MLFWSFVAQFPQSFDIFNISKHGTTTSEHHDKETSFSLFRQFEVSWCYLPETNLVFISFFFQLIAFNGGTGSGSDTDWLLANIRQYGYYRVNYDANNWELISAQLMTDNTVGISSVNLLNACFIT